MLIFEISRAMKYFLINKSNNKNRTNIFAEEEREWKTVKER